MAFDPNTPVGKVRLKIGDWSEPPILPDSVITSAIADCNGYIPRAASLCAQYVLGALTAKTHAKLPQLEVWSSEQFDNYVKYLQMTVLNPNLSSVAPIPYSGPALDQSPITAFVEEWSASTSSPALSTSSSLPATSSPVIVSDIVVANYITEFNSAGLRDGVAIWANFRSSDNDGGGGMLLYSAGSTATPDGIVVYLPNDKTSSDAGRFIRHGYTVFGFQGVIQAAWAGVSPDNADNTTALQACVEALPSYGGVIALGIGTYALSHVRLDGYSANKSGVTLRGEGPGTHLRKLAQSDIPTAEGRRQSVVFWLSGNNMVVRDMKVEGNWSRGATGPVFTAAFYLGETYPAAGKALSIAADGTSGTKLPTDRILVVTALGAGKVSSSTNFNNDIALGYVTDVSSQRWSWETMSGYQNNYETDNDYQYGHGVYAHGQVSATDGCQVLNVECTDCWHGGIVSGSGPLFADQVGVGATRILVQGCYSHHNRGSNFGGGFSIYGRYNALSTVGGTSSGLRLDGGCDYCTITNITIDGEGSSDNGGVNLYNSHHCNVVGAVIRNSAPGLWVKACDGFSASNIQVEASTSAGVSIYQCKQASLSAVTVAESNGHGIKFELCTYPSATGCTSRLNGGSGLVLDSTTQGTFNANVCAGNGTDGTADSAGILVIDSTNNIVTSNRCFDPNGGGGTQNYGINETGTSSLNTYSLNSLKSNKTTAKVILSGSYDFMNVVGAPTLKGFAAAGTLVKKNGNSSVPTGTPTVVTFGAEVYDTEAAHSTSTNTSRIVVPEGVESVALSASIAFTVNATGVRKIRILKNGASFPGQPEAAVMGATSNVVACASPTIAVVAGDFFEVEVEQDAGVALSALADDKTWFFMDVK